MQTSQQLREKVIAQKSEQTKRHTPMRVAMFMKSAKEKEILKQMKKQVNGKLVQMFGTKRPGNVQFSTKSTK